MRFRLVALIGAGLASGASAFGQADSSAIASVLARYWNAAGGRAAVDGVQSRTLRGCYLPTSETPCVPFDVYSSGKDKWKTVMTAPGILRTERIGNGQEAFDLDSSGRQPLKPETAADQELAFSFHAQLHPDQHLSGLSAKGANLLEGKDKTGRSVELEFDPKSGLLSRIGNYQLLDYRPVAGVSTPLAIQNIKTKVRYVFTKAEHNSPLDETAFRARPIEPLQAGMRRAALDEAVRGLDVAAAERATLESLEAFSPHEGRILFDLIRRRGYKRALEIGTAYGNSAIWMAMALKRNGGKLVTIERESEYAKVARENFRKAGLSDAIDSRVNDALTEIPAVPGQFDLVFMDTGTTLHRKFLDLVAGRVASGGAVISHNADAFERDQPDFRRAVMEDPQFETSLVLTPGGGMSISIVRPARAQE